MKISSQNPQVQPPRESASIRQGSNKNHYPRHDFYFTLFYPDLDQTFEAIDPDSSKDYKQADFISEYNDDQENGGQETVDPEREVRKILDPEKDHHEREFPNQHDDEDINPNRNVPEEDNDLTKEDDAIIKEPTREIDDPYRPGHGDVENIPSIEKEFPKEDLKENIKTDF